MKKLIVIVLSIVSIISLQAQNDDFEVVKKRLQLLVAEQKYKDEGIRTENIDKILSEYNIEGKWNDIDYHDPTASRWSPSNHWYHLLDMAYLYKSKNSKYFQDKELLDKIISGIRFWLKTKPVCENYWWNAIGVPLTIGEVLILLETELEKADVLELVKLMRYGIKPEFYDYHGKATGQNLLWLATVHIYSCCIDNDREGMKRGFAAAAEEIMISEKEGIQPDFSFHQHGPQLYSFGYGRGFTFTSAKLMYLAYNTVYAFPQEKVKILSNYILDGQQWMTRNGYLEYTAMGREISRGSMSVNSLIYASELLMKVDTTRAKRYHLFIDQLKNGKRNEPLIGNRYFPNSDFMVQQRPHYYFSLKCASDRIIASESGNGENVKGFYQGYGTYYVVKRGNEYKDIFPIWNWRQLPGSLVEQSEQPLPLFNFGKGNRGETSFVYGVSNGMYGCFGYDYKKDHVMAKRAWFFFDDEIVSVVNNINYAGTGSLYQTINQCFLNGDIIVDNKLMTNTENSYRNASWVYHDSIAYFFSKSPNELKISSGMEEGSWRDINQVGNPAVLSAKVFNLNLNLGKDSKNAGFVYAILPGISVEQARNYRMEDNFMVLKNDTTIQAIHQKKLNQVQAVFYNSGKLKLPWKNKTLIVDKPGLILLILDGEKISVEINQPPFRESGSFELSGKFVSSNGAVRIE